MTSVEFRDRSKRAPGDDFRIFLGRSQKPAELQRLRALRELLQRLASRGEWDVLRAIRAGDLTPETVARLVDQHGIADYRAHVELAPPPDAPNLADHVAHFLETVEKDSTRKTYRIGLDKLVAYRPGPEPLGEGAWHEVRPHHVQDLKSKLLRRLARATVATTMASWSAFFDWAILREESEAAQAGREPLLIVNPVQKARAWITVHPTRQRFFTRKEYEALIEAAEPAMKAQYATLTLCGLRGSEFRHLPPAHVKPTEKVHVGPWGDWAPKGWPEVQRGVRDIPVHHARLRPLLEEYAREWAGEVTFFVNPRTGDPWTETVFRRQFYVDVKAAGMVAGTRDEGEATPQGVSPHTCRHTFASWLAQADVQLLKIARLMGDTEETVRRYYAHLLPADLERSVQRLFDAR